MKKYLVGFGLVMIFFAGFSSVWAQAQGGNSGATSQNSSNGSNSNSSSSNSNSWKPVYIEDSDVNNYTTCKNAGGTWITVPLIGKPQGGKCLRIEKDGDKAAACDGLNFDTIKDFGDIEIEQFGRDYKISDISKVEYKNGGYYIDSGHEKIEVKCYEYDDKTKKLGKMLYGKELTDKNICLVDKNDLRITAIDFPVPTGDDQSNKNKKADEKEYLNPEWYCPYDWTGKYPDNIDPYNPKEWFFQKKLKNEKGKKDKVYSFEVEDSSELMHDCARRMYALGRACAKRVERATDVVDKIKQLRRDFYRKMSIKFWRGSFIKAKGIEAYNQWLEIKDMTFKKICGGETECSESVYKTKDDKGKDKDKFGKDKTNAIKSAQEWIKNNNLMTSSENPAKYFKNKASDLWEIINVEAVQNVLKEDIVSIWGVGTTNKKDKKKLKDYMGGVYEDKNFKFEEGFEWKESGDLKKAKDVYANLLSKANAKNYSATLISKYITRRSNNLNVAVSNNQTSHVEVTRLLRAYDGSKEADLMIFDDRKDGKKMINVFDKIINLAVQTMGTLAILLLIISGVLMVVSQGDENQLSQAKTVFIYTLIGLIVGFLSYTIVRFVIDTLLS